MKKWGSLVLGVLLVLLGALWCLQGIGLLAGSSMTGKEMWFVIGLVVGLAGLALLGTAVKNFRRGDTTELNKNRDG